MKQRRKSIFSERYLHRNSQKQKRSFNRKLKGGRRRRIFLACHLKANGTGLHKGSVLSHKWLRLFLGALGCRREASGWLFGVVVESYRVVGWGGSGKLTTYTMMRQGGLRFSQNDDLSGGLLGWWWQTMREGVCA